MSSLCIICLHVNVTVTVWLQADLHDLQLSVDTFGTKFDVVLIDPPWEEYVRRAPGVSQGESWSWQEIKNLEIDKITDNPSFIFLWSAPQLRFGNHVASAVLGNMVCCHALP